MQEDKQIDGRDLRNGGWFWGQRELLHVFTPLIGAEASWLYMVLCDLIPEKAKNPQLELTVRWMQKASGLSIGTVHRKLAVLTGIGMIEEEKRGNRRPSIFKLVDLRKLAAVGTEELKRRIGVPVGNTKDKGEGDLGLREDADEGGQNESGSGESPSDEGDVPPEAPESSSVGDVPVGNSGKTPAEMTLAELLVFQKRGVGVPKTGGRCSSESGPFNVFNPSILKTNSPLPLSQAKGGLLPKIAASTDQKGKVKRPSHDAEDLRAAVTKVKRECGLSSPRIDRVIEEAMRIVASRLDAEPNPDWNAHAESIVRGYQKFLDHKPLMLHSVNARKFIAELMWLDERKWPPMDQQKKRHKRMEMEAQVGMYRG